MVLSILAHRKILNKLLPILALLFFFSCDEEVAGPEVLRGCLDIQACNYNPNATLNNNSCIYYQDCNGDCGGVAILDDCGVCQGDNSTCLDQCGVPNGDGSACIDCAGVLNGNAVEDCLGNCNGSAVQICDFCIPFDEILPDFESAYPSDWLLSTCDSYNTPFSNTRNDPLPDSELSYIFYEAHQGTDCRILFSAPHSQKTYRYNEDLESGIVCNLEETHEREWRTGVLAELLNELSGCPAIAKKYKSDDPNHHHFIPECTITNVFEDNIGEMLPYKEKIFNYINENNSINFVIDLHGKQASPNRIEDVDLGTCYGNTLESAVGDCMPVIIEYIMLNRDITVSENEEFATCQDETVTRFVSDYINGIVDAIQFEIERDEYRSCSSDKFSQLVYAFLEIIHIANYLYNYDEFPVTNE